MDCTYASYQVLRQHGEKGQHSENNDSVKQVSKKAHLALAATRSTAYVESYTQLEGWAVSVNTEATSAPSAVNFAKKSFTVYGDGSCGVRDRIHAS